MLRDSILSYLTTVTTTMSPLATMWHVIFGAAIVGMAAGWRPTTRLASLLLFALAASVAATAAVAGNPFNAISFAVLAALILRAGMTTTTAHLGSTGLLRLEAALLLAFAWFYPHFTTQAWTRLLYAAPLGTIPCPTLAAIAAVSLLMEGAHSARVRRIAGVFAVAYGIFGMAYLGVTIDAILVVGGVMTLVAGAGARRAPALATRRIST